MKTCRLCSERKPLADFPPDKRGKDGRQARCRCCVNTVMKEHYRRNPAEGMLRRAKARAAAKGLGFNITLSDIIPLPTHCPVFGVELRMAEFGSDPHAYSLDRIRNEDGYVKGNVVVMSYLANRLKNNGTARQHEQIARWMRSQGCE